MDRGKFLLIRDSVIKIQRFIKKKYNHKCNICFEFKKMLTPYKCNHEICESCFNNWIYKASTCPTCRGDILDHFKISNFNLNNTQISLHADTLDESLPRNFRPRSPSISPPHEFNNNNRFIPIDHNLESSSIDFELFNTFIEY